MSLLLHSRSIQGSIENGDAPTLALLQLSSLGFLHLEVTPTTELKLLAAFAEYGIVPGRLDSRYGNWTLVEENQLRLIEPIQQNVRYQDAVVPGSQVTRVEWALGRRDEFDFFVVKSGDALLNSDRRSRKHVGVEEALDLVRLLAVHCKLFFITPQMQVNEGFYYTYRAKRTFHEFQRGYTYALIAKTLPEGAVAQMESLYRRLELLCRAADRASYFGLCTPTGDNEDEALYHAAFLVLLATGIFDDLARLMTWIYDIRVHREAVSLRSIKRSRPFFAALASVNAEMLDAVRDSSAQLMLKALYPLRDVLQHRAFMRPYRLISKTGDPTMFILPADAAAAIQRLAEGGVTLPWNLVRRPSEDSIAPYDLARRSTELVALIVNRLLPLFKWETMMGSVPAEERSKIEASWGEFEAGVGKFLGWGVEPLYF